MFKNNNKNIKKTAFALVTLLNLGFLQAMQPEDVAKNIPRTQHMQSWLKALNQEHAPKSMPHLLTAPIYESSFQATKPDGYIITSGANSIVLSEETINLSPVLKRLLQWNCKETQNLTVAIDSELTQQALNLLGILINQESDLNKEYDQAQLKLATIDCAIKNFEQEKNSEIDAVNSQHPTDFSQQLQERDKVVLKYWKKKESTLENADLDSVHFDHYKNKEEFESFKQSELTKIVNFSGCDENDICELIDICQRWELHTITQALSEYVTQNSHVSTVSDVKNTLMLPINLQRALFEKAKYKKKLDILSLIAWYCRLEKDTTSLPYTYDQFTPNITSQSSLDQFLDHPLVFTNLDAIIKFAISNPFKTHFANENNVQQNYINYDFFKSKARIVTFNRKNGLMIHDMKNDTHQKVCNDFKLLSIIEELNKAENQKVISIGYLGHFEDQPVIYFICDNHGYENQTHSSIHFFKLNQSNDPLYLDYHYLQGKLFALSDGSIGSVKKTERNWELIAYSCNENPPFLGNLVPVLHGPITMKIQKISSTSSSITFEQEFIPNTILYLENHSHIKLWNRESNTHELLFDIPANKQCIDLIPVNQTDIAFLLMNKETNSLTLYIYKCTQKTTQKYALDGQSRINPMSKIHALNDRFVTVSLPLVKSPLIDTKNEKILFTAYELTDLHRSTTYLLNSLWLCKSDRCYQYFLFLPSLGKALHPDNPMSARVHDALEILQAWTDPKEMESTDYM